MDRYQNMKDENERKRIKVYENERKDRINAPKCRLCHLTPYLQCLSLTWETRLVSGTTRTLSPHTISEVRDVRFDLYVRGNGGRRRRRRMRMRMRVIMRARLRI